MLPKGERMLDPGQPKNDNYLLWPAVGCGLSTRYFHFSFHVILSTTWVDVLLCSLDRWGNQNSDKFNPFSRIIHLVVRARTVSHSWLPNWCNIEPHTKWNSKSEHSVWTNTTGKESDEKYKVSFFSHMKKRQGTSSAVWASQGKRCG
jgi:hypothetical protein